jgi:hypothetical protein
MNASLGGTWVWGQWDTHVAIHGVWVCNKHHKCYIAQIMFHLHKCMPYAILC